MYGGPLHPISGERREELVNGQRTSRQDAAQLEQIRSSHITGLGARTKQTHRPPGWIGEDRQANTILNVPAAALQQPGTRLARREDVGGDVGRNRTVFGNLPIGIARDPIASIDDQVWHWSNAIER